MRVLIITGMKNSGGTERATVNLCDALQREKISTILFSDNGPYVENIKKMGVSHIEGDIHIKSNFLGTGKTVFKLAKILKEQEIDLIHAQMAFPTLLGIISVFLAGRYNKTKILWHSRGLHAQTYKKVCFLFNLFHVYALGNSKQEMYKLINNGMEDTKINYIYNNFSTSFFNQTNPIISKEKYHLKKDEIIIGSVSRLEKERGVDIFLEMCAQLHKNNKHLKFLICGDGSQKKPLEDLAKKLNIDKHTIFLGSVTEMYSVYQLIDILINPLNLSKGEGAGVGNNIVEAFFSKVLVISSDVAAISEIVKENNTGYLIDINKRDESILKIEKILSEFKRDGVIQQNAYNFSQQMFTTEQYGKKIKKIYQKIIENKDIHEI